MTMILAGHETTAQLMSWTLVMLCQHREWIDKLREEVDRVVPGKRAPVYSDLIDLPLVNAVLMETLRVLPPAANVVRSCVEVRAAVGVGVIGVLADTCCGGCACGAGRDDRPLPDQEGHNRTREPVLHPSQREVLGVARAVEPTAFRGWTS